MLSPDDLAILQASEDRILAVELTTGEQFFAEIVMVVDQPPTPDVFLLRVVRGPDGAFDLARPAPEMAPETEGADDVKQAGESILLADLARVARVPGIDYE